VNSKGSDVSRDITLSVVSHRQNTLVNQLLEDLARVCSDRVAVVITQNVPDDVELRVPAGLPAQRILNGQVKGFGANHNAAFKHCTTPYFCVANPDIRLPADPFPPLVESLEHAALAGPLVRSPDGNVEDSARRFPTAGSLLKKLLAEKRKPDYPAGAGPQQVDWLAGMFIVFRREAFEAVGGFDEAYFLYYEDVDICRRLQRRRGSRAIWDPRAEVVHEARRASRRDLRLARHHAASLLRFLFSPSARR
jgi:GT2 family glycosyltransferase